MADIATTIVHRRRWIAVGCLIIGLLLLPFAPQTADKLEVGGAALDRSEAAKVDTLLQTEFSSPFANYLVLVATGMPSLDDNSGLDVLMDIEDTLRDIASVTSILSYLHPVDPVFLSEHGTFLLVGISVEKRRMDEVVLELRRATHSLQDQLRSTYPEIALAWTERCNRGRAASSSTDAHSIVCCFWQPGIGTVPGRYRRAGRCAQSWSGGFD